MKNEFADEKLAGILDRLTGDLPAHVEERAMREMAAAGGRSPSTAVGINKLLPNRRRVIALAVGAAVVLFGLGFVPFPARGAKGIWQRALAATTQAAFKAEAMHQLTRQWDARGEVDNEYWSASDGFSRFEQRWNGELESMYMDVGTGLYSYQKSLDAKYKYSDSPPIKGASRDVGYTREQIKSFLGSLAKLNNFTVQESQQRTLFTSGPYVVELSGTVEKSFSSGDGPEYFPGDRLVVRAEIDPETDLVRSIETQVFPGGERDPFQRIAFFEWNMGIPESVREFNPPKGTKLVKYVWWSKRADKKIEKQDTSDWEVTLSAIDVNKRGDLYLTLKRQLLPNSDPAVWKRNPVSMDVEATDNAGGVYQQLHNGSCATTPIEAYWEVILARNSSTGNPDNVTLKIHPYPRGAGEDQFVVFANIPLPPRQQGIDLHMEDTEIVQY
jgi:hypothetical protein